MLLEAWVTVHESYADLQKFCSVLWLSLGWPKHSWDHMTGFLLNQKLISSEGSINKCWLFPQGLPCSHGRDNGDTEFRWMACSQCSLSRFAIQFNRRWSRLLSCLWKGQGVQKQQERNGGRVQAAEEPTLFFFIPEWMLCSWGRRQSTPLIELPAGLE